MSPAGKVSSGTLLYRKTGNELEVLLVKPSGPAARYGWSIPKGLSDDKETLEEAARRETFEETGCKPLSLTYLGYCDYSKSRKRVHCFGGELPPDQQPSAASWEVSEAKLLPVSKAREVIHSDQRKFLDMIQGLIYSGK